MGLGKLGALIAIVGLTALPFASFGPIKFKGHELLRNRRPDVTKGVLGEGADATKTSFTLEPPSDAQPAETAPFGSEKSEDLFRGDDRWLHWLYLGLGALALLALLLPGPRALLGLLALLGLGGTIYFLESFEKRLLSQSPSSSFPSTPKSSGGEAFRSMISLDWEIGAYVTLAGFGAILLAALQRRHRGSLT